MDNDYYHPPAWQRAKAIDANTPLPLKLGGLFAIVLAVHVCDGWIDKMTTQANDNTAAIAALDLKLSGKLDSETADLHRMMGAINQLSADFHHQTLADAK